jgi:tight adherence protein B
MNSISIIVFTSIVISGFLVMAFTRSQWSDELSRLGKQQKRLQQKNNDNPEVNIFLTQRTDYLSRLLSLAGLEAQYDKMKMSWIVTSIVTGVVFAIILYIELPELWVLGLILGIPIGAGGFIGYVSFLAKRRQARLTEQLPQILETMASALKAGSPVMEVFKVLADTTVDPIRAEFKRGLVSLQLGKPFRDVMHEMTLRIRTPDFKLLTHAIFISQDVGGNLADVVATIAEVIRERFKLRDFMNALTAQGKATAMFIGCLPYFITLITVAFSPGYIMPFLNNTIARIVMVGLVIWEVIGFWILMKMTTFEV